jgi:hypothetical protein
MTLKIDNYFFSTENDVAMQEQLPLKVDTQD